MHLIMFDIDGTLVDSDAFEEKLFLKAIEDVMGFKPESYDEYPHRTDTGIVVEMVERIEKRDVTDKEFATIRDHFTDLVMDHLDANPDACTAIPGAIDLLDKIKAHENCRLSLATGGWGPTACFKLASAGFDISRMIMATSDDHFDRMEIMMQSLSRVQDTLKEGERITDITFVGDGPWDKIAAEGLGWRFIGIGDKVKDADLHLTDFMDAHDLVMNLN